MYLVAAKKKKKKKSQPVQKGQGELSKKKCNSSMGLVREGDMPFATRK